MDVQELWETVRDFCTEYYMEVGLAAGALVLLVILVAICRSAKKQRQQGDWMDDFEARMAAFERREGRKIATAPEDDRTIVEKIADKAVERSLKHNVVAVTPAPVQPLTVEVESKPQEVREAAPVRPSAPVEEVSAAQALKTAAAKEQPASFHFNIQLAEVKITCENWPEGLPQVTFQPQAAVKAVEPSVQPKPQTASLFPGDALDLDRPLRVEDLLQTEPVSDVVVEKINIVKREDMDEHRSVSRSGRIYSEEEIRAQIRK